MSNVPILERSVIYEFEGTFHVKKAHWLKTTGVYLLCNRSAYMNPTLIKNGLCGLKKELMLIRQGGMTKPLSKTLITINPRSGR